MKSDINCKTPSPVTFNCWKHHAGFIKSQIDVISKKNISNKELKKLLLVTGNSQMDIYLGNLLPKSIAGEIIDKLNSFGLFSEERFKRWLYEKDKHFKLLKISDDSIWTLRLGEQGERYVHIHPGRHSKHTVRVKASTLKTAITAMIRLKERTMIGLDLDFINDIRKNILGISPLKTFSLSTGLGKLITILNQDSN